MTAACLTLDAITHRYDGTEVVRDVSLELHAGEVMCLLGPSGCGKSTTLRIAAGVERQSAGRVLLDGVEVSGAHRHAPPEDRNVGLIFQDFALFPHMTVTQNIAFGLKGAPGRVRELLDRVDLNGYGPKYPHQLSGGEQQRVALARALAARPAVLLMDEPFSGLDNRLRDDIRDDTLHILRDEGTAVLLVTHDPEEAMRMADTIALMRDGRIVQSGAPYHLYNDPVDIEAAAFFSDLNIMRSRIKNSQADTPFGFFLAPGLAEGTEVDIVIRPQHLGLDFDRAGRGPLPSDRDGVAARGIVTRARFLGGVSLVELDMGNGHAMKATVPAVFLPKPGTPLWVSMRRARCLMFPRREKPFEPVAASA